MSLRTENRPGSTGADPAARASAWWSVGVIRYGLLVLVLLLLVGVVLRWLRPPDLHGVVLQSPDRAADFTLMSSRGTPLSLSEFRGKIVLLYFGYTFCPDVCPTTLNDLARARTELGGKADDVQVIMVTVDPARDTAEYLASYLVHFDPTFIGMTGSVAEIEAVASQYGVFFALAEGSAATGYLVDHTSTVTLIDADGYVREVLPYGVGGEEIATDLAYWMR